MTVYTIPENKIIHTTKIDMSLRAYIDSVHLMQYDVGLPILEVKLFNNGKPYTIPSSAEANIRFKKKDETFVYNPTLGKSSDGSTLYFEVTGQMTLFYGTFNPVIEIIVGNELACSAPLTIIIDKNPIQQGDTESSYEAKIIDDLVNKNMVQSDWNEQDTTNKAYVKNRPFYDSYTMGNPILHVNGNTEASFFNKLGLIPNTNYQLEITVNNVVKNISVTSTNGYNGDFDGAVFLVYNEDNNKEIDDIAFLIGDGVSSDTSGLGNKLGIMIRQGDSSDSWGTVEATIKFVTDIKIKSITPLPEEYSPVKKRIVRYPYGKDAIMVSKLDSNKIIYKFQIKVADKDDKILYTNGPKVDVLGSGFVLSCNQQVKITSVVFNVYGIIIRIPIESSITDKAVSCKRSAISYEQLSFTEFKNETNNCYVYEYVATFIFDSAKEASSNYSPISEKNAIGIELEIVDLPTYEEEAIPIV